MSDTVLVSLITGGCTLAAATITAVVAYAITSRGNELRRIRNKLRTALLDLQAFQRLEDAYTEALAQSGPDDTPHAAKLRIRKSVRESGFDSPSPEAGHQRVLSALNALEDA